MSTQTIWYFLALLAICWTPVTSRNLRTEDSSRYFSSRNQIASPYRQNSFSSGSRMSDHFSRSRLAGPRGQNFFYSESCRTGPDGRTLCSSSTSRNNGPIKRNHFSSGSPQRASSNGYRTDPLSLRNLMTGPYGQSQFSSSSHRKESSKWEPFPSRSPITGLYNQNLILPYRPNPSDLRSPVPGSLSQRQSPYPPKEGIDRLNPFNLRSRIHSSYEKSQYSSKSQMIQPFTNSYAQNVPSRGSPYGHNPVNLRNLVTSSNSRRQNQYRPNKGPYRRNPVELRGKVHSEQSRYSSKSQMTQQSFSSRNPFAEPRPYRQNSVDLRNPTPGSQNPDLRKQNSDITDSRSRKQNGHAFVSEATGRQKQNFANRSGLISDASTSRLASNQNQSSSKRQMTGYTKQTVANSVKSEMQKSNPYPRKS